MMKFLPGTTTTTTTSSWITLVWLVCLCAVDPTTVTAAASSKSCRTVERAGQLKKLLQGNNDVLVLLQQKPSKPLSDYDDDEDDDDDDDREEENDDDPVVTELCQRFADTPAPRVKQLELVKVTDGNLKRKLWETSRPVPTSMVAKILDKVGLGYHTTTKIPPEYPEYILFRASTNPKGVVDGLRYVGGNTIEDVSEFLALQLGTKRLGNFVYSIGSYDVLASKLMDHARAQNTWMLWIYVKVVTRFASYLIQPSLYSGATDFDKELTGLYTKIAAKVYEKGRDFPRREMDRLEGMLSSSTTTGKQIGDAQREKMQQRIYILKKFDDPVEVSRDDHYLFWGKLGLNLFCYLAIVLMIPMLLLADDTTEDDKEGDAKDDSQEETKDGNDKDDKDDDDDSQASGVVVEATAVDNGDDDDEETLMALTVAELRKMCKARGLTVGGKKVELVERLLEEDSLVDGLMGGDGKDE